MRTIKWLTFLRASVLIVIAGGLVSNAQQSQEKKPLIETPSMRLTAARNVFITRTHGSRIPLDVIKSTLEGWGRFTFVETPEKADLIIEISSTGDSGVQVSSSSKVSPETGKEEKSTSTRKDISPTEVKMTVFDSRNKRGLWSAAESVKFAMKEKGKENNLVDASERLASKFHDRLEPPAK
ncbi:MAG TPA: hypothetical protein VGQ12_01460 [Candidatus Angelobacter sp.]|jgi:hypothetical protein|nr:hypothetical protein [Candidatus Angelobacter sp.]